MSLNTERPSRGIKEYIGGINDYLRKKRLYAPLVIAAVFLVLAHFVLGSDLLSYARYLYLGIYLYMIIYYARDFFPVKFLRSYTTRTSGRFFICLAVSVAAAVLSYYVSEYFIDVCIDVWGDEGMIDPYIPEDYVPFIIYALTVLIIKPVGEEIFFRHALISFDTRISLIASSFFSVALYILMNSDYPTGAISLMVPVLVMHFSYLFTKNIYVTSIAHIVYSILDKGPFIVYTMARMMYR